MSRNAIVASVIAKHDAPADAEPVPDASSAPPAGVSETGSAAADVGASPEGSGPGEGALASPAATNQLDHDVLRAKLEHDRQVQRAKKLRRQQAQETSAAEKARKEAEAEAAKWKNLGKDKSFLETIKEAGHDPREVFEAMRAEALKAGTPEAQIESLSKAFEAKLAAALEEHVNPLKKTIEEITADRDALRRQNEQQGFANSFQQQLAVEKYKPLLEEYEPAELFRLASGLAGNPSRLHDAAKALNVPLTSNDGYFNMVDIFNVMHATQAAHQAKIQQRRNQSAAPQTSQGDPKQPPQMKPPVNGTVERSNAATTIGNDLAASRTSEADQLKGMTRQQRVAFLAKKYG